MELDENVAPFAGKSRIGVDALEDLTPNPAHPEFLDAMRTRMASDAELDAILSTSSATSSRPRRPPRRRPPRQPPRAAAPTPSVQASSRMDFGQRPLTSRRSERR